MSKMNRRAALAASGGAIVAAAWPFSPPAAAHETPLPMGAWTPLAEMPFAVQEIYPAPFWRSAGQSFSAKPKPYNILVNAGGITDGEEHDATGAVTFYDPVADKWGFGAPLPEARHHLALVNNNGVLYGVGGFARNARGGWQMRADCWRATDIEGPWEIMRPMPHPQAETACVSLSGFIHVVGGRAPAGSRNRDWRDHIDTDEHWIFDPAANSWHPLAPMPTPRNSCAGAVVNGVLYVIGGRAVQDGNSAAVEVYDPGADRWETARPMPRARGGAAASMLAGKIYVFGGEYFADGGGVYSEAWEYNPRTDKWRAVAAMPRPRHGLGAVTLEGAVYVLGGAAGAGGNGTSAALDRFEI